MITRNPSKAGNRLRSDASLYCLLSCFGASAAAVLWLGTKVPGGARTDDGLFCVIELFFLAFLCLYQGVAHVFGLPRISLRGIPDAFGELLGYGGVVAVALLCDGLAAFVHVVHHWILFG